ncbi:hypothetical protein [Tianweitania sediminis]|uniref:Uncharacterized protein n=1 Tax=Tianweitania sediminis TaxID=1502156 RepID=A0A8J7RFD3_9HYPH|nr:hypothetical protein [Tianweitania sediminis]MBP0437426.1 hypothetical protein [Tianweitania sediminis]
MIAPKRPMKRRAGRRQTPASGLRILPFRIGPAAREFRHYEAIVACRQSTQIDDRVWERYLASDDFAAWHLVDLLQR